MNEINSFYNNELLTGISILAVLKKNGSLEISKALLIHPILSYTEVLKYVKRSNVRIRSIEELIVKYNIKFTNFNTRYLENLSLSINSILLLKQLKLIEIEGNRLIHSSTDFDFKDKSLSGRANELMLASINISEMLKREDVSNLYLSLRIEI